MKKILVFLAVSALLAGCVSIPNTCSIWFDNKSGETIACSVDGAVIFTLEPGKTQIYTMPAGAHTWEAKSDKNYWHGTVDLALGEVTDVAIEAPRLLKTVRPPARARVRLVRNATECAGTRSNGGRSLSLA